MCASWLNVPQKQLILHWTDNASKELNCVLNTFWNGRTAQSSSCSIAIWFHPVRDLHSSSVLNPAAAKEKYQIPSAKASAELAQHENFLPQEALKKESLPRRFRVTSASLPRRFGLKFVFASAREGKLQFLAFVIEP